MQHWMTSSAAVVPMAMMEQMEAGLLSSVTMHSQTLCKEPMGAQGFNYKLTNAWANYHRWTTVEGHHNGTSPGRLWLQLLPPRQPPRQLQLPQPRQQRQRTVESELPS